MAEAFAAQAAVAIENSRLFEAEREQREMSEALEEAACKGVFDKYSIAIDNGIKDKYRAIANNYKTNKQDKS